jgi:ketosteroid isomerase-like protein
MMMTESVGAYARPRPCSAYIVLFSYFLSFATAWQLCPTNSFERRQRHQRLNTQTDENQDPVLRLPLMEAELAALGQGNDPTQLKSAIANAKTAAEFGVRRAQLEFYEAFADGDLKAMERVWATESPVRCVHPAMSSLEGREAVMSSWKQIFSSSGQQGKFNIEPDRVQIEICGLTAICSCVEKTEGGGELEALNIYKREGGNWRMTLHMAGPVIVRRGKEAFF